MKASKPRAETAEDLARVELFYAAQLNDTDHLLQPTELAKVRDLRDDAIWLDAQAGKGRLDPMTALGHVFAFFERRVSGRLNLRKRDLKPHAVPPGTSHDPQVYASDYHLFDRLSRVYSGRFRGSVVVNYLLGALAAAAILCALLTAPPYLEGLLKWIYEYLPANFPFAFVVEFLSLTLIAVIFLIGHTPETRFTKHGRPSWTKFAHRWHERWLEYRVAAEYFRYLELLLPLGTDVIRKLPFLPATMTGPRWHDRYFAWRVAKATLPSQTVKEYCARTLAVMAMQEQYHSHNGRQCGAIADRLHLAAIWFFVISLAICSIDLLVEWALPHCSGEAPEWSDAACFPLQLFARYARAVLLFAAGMLPVLSAAIHGILTTTEYTKIADTSEETAERIHELYDKFAKFQATAEPATPKKLAEVRNTVVAFTEEVINEATGWRATLRDKNVPLT